MTIGSGVLVPWLAFGTCLAVAGSAPPWERDTVGYVLVVTHTLMTLVLTWSLVHNYLGARTATKISMLGVFGAYSVVVLIQVAVEFAPWLPPGLVVVLSVAAYVLWVRRFSVVTRDRRGAGQTLVVANTIGVLPWALLALTWGIATAIATVVDGYVSKPENHLIVASSVVWAVTLPAFLFVSPTAMRIMALETVSPADE